MEATHNSVKRAGRAALAALVACALAVPAAVLAAPGEAHAAPKISAKAKTLAAGKSFTLKVKGAKGKIKWSSTNRKVATVSSKGKVKAKKMGTATVKAKVGKRTYTCKVRVNPRISVSRKTVAAGKSFTLKLAGASGKVKWSSSNKRVAAVSSKGKVRAKKAGTATVTAKIGGKRVASCKVTVRKAAAAHEHSWKKVVVKEAWEEPVYETVVVCFCGEEFPDGASAALHAMAQEDGRHNRHSETRQTGNVSHPAEYAYKCACGAVK